LVHFTKGQRRDELTAQFLVGFTDGEGVLFVGRALEKGRGVANPAAVQLGDRG
jgi:hypothetical protein